MRFSAFLATRLGFPCDAPVSSRKLESPEKCSRAGVDMPWICRRSCRRNSVEILSQNFPSTPPGPRPEAPRDLPRTPPGPPRDPPEETLSGRLTNMTVPFGPCVAQVTTQCKMCCPSAHPMQNVLPTNTLPAPISLTLSKLPAVARLTKDFFGGQNKPAVFFPRTGAYRRIF